MPGDLDIVQQVRALGMPDDRCREQDRRAHGPRSGAVQFYRARASNPIVEISAEHGSGVGDLLDEVVKRLPGSRGARRAHNGEHDEGGAHPAEPQEVGIAIVGRPNAGKSSLVNRLLREERMVVSEVPGTTRDAVDVVLRWHRRDVPHRRHRGHPAARTRGAIGPGRER